MLSLSFPGFMNTMNSLKIPLICNIKKFTLIDPILYMKIKSFAYSLQHLVLLELYYFGILT